MSPFKIMPAIQKATLELRNRTNDKEYGVAVEKGRLQLQRIKPLKDGSCKVTELTEWLGIDSLLAAMESIK